MSETRRTMRMSEAERLWMAAHVLLRAHSTSYACMDALDAAVRAAYREGVGRGLTICNDEMPEITPPPWLPKEE